MCPDPLRSTASGSKQLKDLQEDLQFYPLTNLTAQRGVQEAITLDLLLPYFEALIQGKLNNAVLCQNLHDFCKGNIMRGNLAECNTTNPLRNYASVVTYKVYCEVVRTINSAYAAQGTK